MLAQVNLGEVVVAVILVRVGLVVGDIHDETYAYVVFAAAEVVRVKRTL